MDLSRLQFQVDYNLIGLILLGAFAVFAFIHLMYYIIVFRRLAFYKENEGNESQPPVSLIICARNEFENLQKYLESVLQQNYKQFQVIVVNDCSWDETEEYLETVERQYPHLKVITLKEQERYKHGKKFALAIGIKGAQYDNLLMTDADCRPAGPDWITEVMKAYGSDEKEIVIGYGAYKKESGMLNKWIRFDTAFNAMQYLSYAIGGKAYMGVGRNLSYKKEVFFRSKGFASHFHVMSGDDDLFVNENATNKNVALRINKKAFTYSKPKQSWSAWYLQKKRHLSTSKYYKGSHKFKLGFFYFSQYLFWALAVALIAMQFYWMYVAGAFLLVTFSKWFLTARSFKKLDEGDLIWLFPFFEIFSMLIYPFINLGSRLHRDVSWK